MKIKPPMILALAAVGALAAYYFFFRKKSARARSASGAAGGPTLAPTPFVSNRGTQATPAQPSIGNQLAQQGIAAGGSLLSSLLKSLTGGGGGGGSFGGGGGGGGGRGSTLSVSSGSPVVIPTWSSATSADLGFDFPGDNQQYSDSSGVYAGDQQVSSVDIPSGSDFGGELSSPDSADYGGEG